MSIIGNEDVGLEEVAAVVAIEVNSRIRWIVPPSTTLTLPLFSLPNNLLQ
jgi:hypothetical protein